MTNKMRTAMATVEASPKVAYTAIGKETRTKVFSILSESEASRRSRVKEILDVRVEDAIDDGIIPYDSYNFRKKKTASLGKGYCEV